MYVFGWKPAVNLIQRKITNKISQMLGLAHLHGITSCKTFSIHICIPLKVG